MSGRATEQITGGVLPGEATLAYDHWQHCPCVMTRDDGFPMTSDEITTGPPMDEPVGLVFFGFDEDNDDEASD